MATIAEYIWIDGSTPTQETALQNQNPTQFGYLAHPGVLSRLGI